ncbi:hypothetical protein PV396_32900 [Streptomyces sp. ME02-8801-2C]|uniref:hypothetical protein n=1 Tax=Streptomyces sp. ME02-8801-2C TaxID=3028680 RepID=UPI0029A65EE7|nr:hypothetical protein [Streptomyces sp. ME02-8801-2C]MDX3456695.1 hypothetical protein [Streptomyces sp. ME02-8801-2C]
MDREEHDCPVCGQHVTTVIRRYKTLGAWVPKWVAGPCRNTECEVYVDPAAEAEAAAAAGPRTKGGRTARKP